MDFLNHLTEKRQLQLYLLLPLVISLAGELLQYWPLLALSGVTLFILTGVLPVCCGRESLWVYLALLPASVPTNVFLIRRFAASWIADSFAETRLDGVLWSALAFLTLLSIEELTLLTLSRAIWRKQEEDTKLQAFEDENTKLYHQKEP